MYYIKVMLTSLAALIGFPSSMLVIMEVKRVLNLDPNLLLISAVIGVLAIAALIGTLDDLVGLSKKKKAIYVMFASVPLLIIQTGEPVLETPFYIFDIPSWFYWFFLVPIGITGAANALNMSAGYNGLESGEFSIISFFLLIISYLKYPDSVATLIFSGLLGVSIALWIFNKYPSKVFVGNVGTFGLGATIAAGAILGKIEFYGVICILPAFYEFFATIYYGLFKRIERRNACMNPVILKNGSLKPPRNTEKFTLAYLLLGKRQMHEKKLVRVILALYLACGIVALSFAVFWTYRIGNCYNIIISECS
ncbi:MAG TPA: hypothetical protein EYP22_03495 [Methanosarcinales archaeon]|nr:hypothetical protein [Methanosarcinales archaeon]